MRKKLFIIFMAVYIGFSGNSFVLAKIDQLDSLDSPFKDLENSLKQDSLKDLPIQKDYKPPQPINQPTQPDLIPFPSGQTQPLLQVPTYKDKLSTDRAILKNQERLKELMAEQKKQLSASIEGAGFRIPNKYRFIIELLVIALSITIFGLMFYKKKVKKEEEAKVTDEDKGPDDGIVFYDLK